MAGLLDNLADFFEGLFSSDPQALRAKRALREQAELLQEVRPPVYAARSEQILPGFAQSWGQVHALLAPLRDLFDKTLGHTERKVQEQTLVFLVESILSGEVADRRMALSYEAIKERLLRSDDASKEAAALSAESSTLLLDLRRQDTEAVQKDFEALFRLKALAGHSLVPLLTRFGYDASQPTQQYHAVDGSSLLTDLLDLYFVTEGLEFSVGLEQLLGLLLEKVGPSKAAENRRKTAVILAKVRELSRGPCSPHLLLQLIRLLQRNPDAQPDTQRFTERYVQTYAGTIADRFTRDRDRALREQSESSMEADIAALFPGTPLLPLAFYNEETSDQLTDVGLPGLSAIKPLRILRSFCFSVLKTGYLDAVKLVVLNGFFTDKEWGQKLSDSLYAAEEVLAHIEEFDQNVETDTKIGLPALEKYLLGKVPLSSVPRALVDKLNRAALGLLEDEARVLSLLAQKVQQILTDYKVPQPQFVGNIKGLGGKDQRSMLENLINGYNKTAGLLRILKHFIVLK